MSLYSKKKCSPDEVALKSYFLGPQSENGAEFQAQLCGLTKDYLKWRTSQFISDGRAISQADRKSREFNLRHKKLALELQKIGRRFQGEIPKFSPRYLGHMFSELTLPGLLGHWIATLHNPNNVSHESSRVGLKIESEAISGLAKMIGWKKAPGHFTSCGSIANLEAILRMRSRLKRYAPTSWHTGRLLISHSAHYSWKKALSITGFDESNLHPIKLNEQGRMDITELDSVIFQTTQPILGIVSLMGSTEFGSVDDIDGINEIINKYPAKNIWHHVDAAYGGFFACTANVKLGTHLHRQIRALKKITSITLDPHKLGYIPYACGAFLCQENRDYFYDSIDAPYLNFGSQFSGGVQTVEGSRTAAGATATLLSIKSIGFTKRGLGLLLSRQLRTTDEIKKSLQLRFENIIIPEGLDLNVLCWTMATEDRKLSESNELVEKIYRSTGKGNNTFFVAKTKLNLQLHPWLKDFLISQKGIRVDTDYVHFIRTTVMNPFFLNKETKTRFADSFCDKIETILNR